MAINLIDFKQELEAQKVELAKKIAIARAARKDFTELSVDLTRVESLLRTLAEQGNVMYKGQWDDSMKTIDIIQRFYDACGDMQAATNTAPVEIELSQVMRDRLVASAGVDKKEKKMLAKIARRVEQMGSGSAPPRIEMEKFDRDHFDIDRVLDDWCTAIAPKTRMDKVLDRIYKKRGNYRAQLEVRSAHKRTAVVAGGASLGLAATLAILAIREPKVTTQPGTAMGMDPGNAPARVENANRYGYDTVNPEVKEVQDSYESLLRKAIACQVVIDTIDVKDVKSTSRWKQLSDEFGSSPVGKALLRQIFLLHEEVYAACHTEYKDSNPAFRDARIKNLENDRDESRREYKKLSGAEPAEDDITSWEIGALINWSNLAPVHRSKTFELVSALREKLH